jgi:hypothetical protein
MSDGYLPEVDSIQIYRNDVVVVRKAHSARQDAPIRGDVKEFSLRSRKRLAFVAANTIVQFTQMITLTYPKEFPSDGRKVKSDLSNFLDFVRRDQARPDYLWFLEFQKRGAPHIHLLLDAPWPSTLRDKVNWRFRVRSAWYRIVGSGDEKHLLAGTSVEKLRTPEGGKRYAVKYALKMYQKIVPLGYRNCGRFWGHSQAVKPLPLGQYRCTEDDIRAVLEGWEHAPREDHPVYRVLYNQAERFQKWLFDTRI